MEQSRICSIPIKTAHYLKVFLHAAILCEKDIFNESSSSSHGRASSKVGGGVVEPSSILVIQDQQSMVSSVGTM